MISDGFLTNITGIGWTAIILMTIWSLIWKGLALWKAAKKSDKAWFIALLIINTVGILEIFYIYIFSKRNQDQINPIKDKKHD